MRSGVIILLFMLMTTGFCQRNRGDVGVLLQQGQFLDAFQNLLQQDVNYTQYAIMTNAARIILNWGTSTDGQWFSLSNTNGEVRSYYFPVNIVLSPFTNLHSNDPELWELLSLYYGKGLWEEWFSSDTHVSRFLAASETYLKRTRSITPEIMAYRAMAHQRIGQTNEAWSIITNTLRSHPDNFFLIYLQASLLLEEGRNSEALLSIQKIYPHIKKHEHQLELSLLSARLYLRLAQPREALFITERLLSLRTNQQDLLVLLEACAHLRDWRRLHERGQMLVGLNPNNTHVLSEIARLFVFHNNPEWAEIFFDRALQNFGTTPLVRGRFYFYWGEVHRHLRQTSKALWAYERAKEEFMRSDPPSTENLALIEMMMHRTRRP